MTMYNIIEYILYDNVYEYNKIHIIYQYNNITHTHKYICVRSVAAIFSQYTRLDEGVQVTPAHPISKGLRKFFNLSHNSSILSVEFDIIFDPKQIILCINLFICVCERETETERNRDRDRGREERQRQRERERASAL